MSTVLSSGLDLSSLSAADLASLVEFARANASKPVRVAAPKVCIVVPATGACARCGVPGGAGNCDPQAGVSFSATIRVRRHLLR